MNNMEDMKDVRVCFEKKGDEINIDVKAGRPQFLTAIELLLRSFSDAMGVPIQELVRVLTVGIERNTEKLKEEAADHGGESNQDAVR